jgi:hypothetical protein
MPVCCLCISNELCSPFTGTHVTGIIIIIIVFFVLSVIGLLAVDSAHKNKELNYNNKKKKNQCYLCSVYLQCLFKIFFTQMTHSSFYLSIYGP